MPVLLLTLHCIAAAIVFGAAFIRLSKTNDDTLISVHFAIWLNGAVALLALYAPIAWGWRPDVLHVVMMGSTAIMQVITSRHWKGGVPIHFQRSAICPRR